MKNTRLILLCTVALLSFVSCKKSSNEIIVEEEAESSTLVVEFDHRAGGFKIQKDTEYTNALGQDFTVDLLQYYVSNLKLVGSNGKTYTVPQDSSYFLIDAFDKSSVHVNVPVGDYDKVIFTLGVDSLKSTSPVEQRTGVLDPADNSMYWAWNSGYRFLAIEGSSSYANSIDKKYRYHIGGYGGYDTRTFNNIKIIELDLTTKGIAKVRKDRKSQIHLIVDIAKIFNGDNNIDISDVSTIMSVTEPSVKIANNYTKMFTHDHTHN